MCMILSNFIYGVYSIKALPKASCWQRPSKERKRREGGWAGKRCSSEMGELRAGMDTEDKLWPSNVPEDRDCARARRR